MKKLLSLLLIIAFSSDGFSRMRLKELDVSAGTFKIKNVAGFPHDYNGYQFVVNSTAYDLSTLNITSGNLNAGVDEEVTFSGMTFPTAASVSLWYPGMLVPSNIFDFMQYGSAGHPHEADADAAGLWTIGDYIMGSGPYIHTGGPTDEGVTHWQSTSGMSTEEFMNRYKFSVYPNPVVNSINVTLSPNVLDSDLSLQVIDLNGKMIIDVPANQIEMSLPVNDLPTGIYMVMIANKQAVLEKDLFQIN